MKEYIKRWLKNLIVIILICILSCAILGLVILMDYIFKYNSYIGWSILMIVIVTAITSFQSK